MKMDYVLPVEKYLKKDNFINYFVLFFLAV
jgi:hypothetical protein